MSLTTPSSVRKLQRALYAKAKANPAYRFYALYDKIYRKDGACQRSVKIGHFLEQKTDIVQNVLHTFRCGYVCLVTDGDWQFIHLGVESLNDERSASAGH